MLAIVGGVIAGSACTCSYYIYSIGGLWWSFVCAVGCRFTRLMLVDSGAISFSFLSWFLFQLTLCGEHYISVCPVLLLPSARG